MAGGVSNDSGAPRVLVEETRHVLDAQQQLVHRQRSRATSAIRLILTVCGLLLTLVSIGVSAYPVSSEPAGVPGLGPQSAGFERTIALALLVTVSLLACRMLCAALVVLEPKAATHPLAELLTAPVLSADPPTDGAESATVRFDGPPALRAGLDADAATDLSETTDPYQAVLAYNAGCVAGNSVIARHNRWYLTRVYRSGVLVVVLVTAAIIGVLVLHGP